jgi:hypothetical protein
MHPKETDFSEVKIPSLPGIAEARRNIIIRPSE